MILRSTGIVCVLATATNAAIIPSWRVNPIPPAMATLNPQLQGATSVSLLVSLTGNSLFSAAAMQLDETDLPGLTLFNQSPFGTDTRPSSTLVALFPDLEFDSYVATTDSAQAAAIPGAWNPPSGAPIFGPASPNQINIRWGATPPTGPLGGSSLEIARITIRQPPLMPGQVINVRGVVIASDAPAVQVPLPPLIIPEPSALVCVGFVVLTTASRRRARA